MFGIHSFTILTVFAYFDYFLFRNSSNISDYFLSLGIWPVFSVVIFFFFATRKLLETESVFQDLRKACKIEYYAVFFSVY